MRRTSKPKGITIDVPYVPPSEAGPRDAESRAVAEHPEFRRLIAEGRRNRAAGKGLSAREVFADRDDAGGSAQSSLNGTGPDELPSVNTRLERAARD